MPEDIPKPIAMGWRSWLLRRVSELRHREGQIFLVLALVIGALTGLAVVAFILLTEHMGMRLYPVGGARWRRVLFPVAGSLSIGYLLYRYFPNARGSGVPQTKAALFARGGRITLRTVLGKFFCTSATLASGIPLGREGPSVQVGAGIGSVLDVFSGCARSKSRGSFRWERRRRLPPPSTPRWPPYCFHSKRSRVISTHQ
jgi:H+/Cl- antiporter ClcA